MGLPSGQAFHRGGEGDSGDTEPVSAEDGIVDGP